MPGTPNVTAQIKDDPLGFMRHEMDYWLGRVSEPFGGSTQYRDQPNTGMPDQYQPTGQDYQQGFEMTNPQMSDAYSQAMPSWIKKLQDKLRRGGQVAQDALAPQQQARQQMQQGQQPQMNPMEQRANALNAQYNMGRNMGQGIQGILGRG